jgi:diguanylate cyclase (GGDEF)-like protein
MLKNFTLLFVEDDTGTQEQLKIMLIDEVKDFYQAYDGAEGLEIYKNKKPDIILTDINMPILNGLDMVEEIKKIDKDQPVLMMSAFDEKDILLNAINIGIDGFIVKPVDMTQLNNKLNQIAKNLQNKIDSENRRVKALKEIQKKEIQRLYNLAHYDVLTNIPNRYLFNEKLDQAILKANKNKSKVALFFIDLDDFKKINDTYGHKTGDYVLVTIVSCIQKVIRNSDIFARIGGDELALIIENVTGRECLEKLAKKIIQAVSVPFYFNEHRINISCSIGISQYQQNINSKDELIHFADLAMYNTKSTGKSNFSFYEES